MRVAFKDRDALTQGIYAGATPPQPECAVAVALAERPDNSTRTCSIQPRHAEMPSVS